MAEVANYRQILDFWFAELDRECWWTKSDELDEAIRRRFFEIHQQAIRCELYRWREDPGGCLAEIIVIDQFSRNLYRGHRNAFIHDPLALCLSQQAMANRIQENLDNNQKTFLYMPYMHSESLAMHEIAVELYREPGLGSSLEFELKHKAIIEQFGRYPHRNGILGRMSTKEEIEFLQGTDSSF